jgi:hypothetical protein
MTWLNVLSKLEFYDQFGTPQGWGSGLPFGGILAFANCTASDEFEDDVIGYFEDMYTNSPTGAAATALDAAVDNAGLTSRRSAAFELGDGRSQARVRRPLFHTTPGNPFSGPSGSPRYVHSCS